jgi:hypothetical protein
VHPGPAKPESTYYTNNIENPLCRERCLGKHFSEGEGLIPAPSPGPRGCPGRSRGEKSRHLDKYGKAFMPAKVPLARSARGDRSLPRFSRIPGLISATPAQAPQDADTGAGICSSPLLLPLPERSHAGYMLASGGVTSNNSFAHCRYIRAQCGSSNAQQ